MRGDGERNTESERTSDIESERGREKSTLTKGISDTFSNGRHPDKVYK